VDLGGADVVAAASTIKLPLLIAFFQDVDQGKVQLDQPIVMRKELIATEAGEMQYQPVGSKFSAIKTVTEMITVSDNTASNMTIDLLGGMESLNQRFKSWGLTGTMIRNPLPDVAGTNTTSARDMAQMLSQLSDGKLVSSKSRDRIFDILRRVHYNTLLPKGLGEGATIAHKTGTIGTMLADVGLIDTATGQRYVAAVLVKRPKDDERADELIQQISRLGYQAFNQQQSAAAPTVKEQPKDVGRSRIAQP
jgi:beta-lactamase class A